MHDTFRSRVIFLVHLFCWKAGAVGGSGAETAAGASGGARAGGRAYGWAAGWAWLGAWSLELRDFTSRRQQDLSFESAPTPPSAGFNVTFEDLTLDTAAGAPLIIVRLTAGIDWGLYSPGITQPQGDLGPCDVALGLGPEESR